MSQRVRLTQHATHQIPTERWQASLSLSGAMVSRRRLPWEGTLDTGVAGQSTTTFWGCSPGHIRSWLHTKHAMKMRTLSFAALRVCGADPSTALRASCGHRYTG